jgi:hypothetical protein
MVPLLDSELLLGGWKTLPSDGSLLFCLIRNLTHILLLEILLAEMERSHCRNRETSHVPQPVSLFGKHSSARTKKSFT